MLKKITSAAAIAVVASLAASTGASAGGYGYAQCHQKKISYPVWKTVWVAKRVPVAYGCGYKTVKYAKKVKVWHSKWKRVCH